MVRASFVRFHRVIAELLASDENALISIWDQRFSSGAMCKISGHTSVVKAVSRTSFCFGVCLSDKTGAMVQLPIGSPDERRS